VNKEISSFSKKLEKCLKSFNGVSLIKTNYARDNFTRLGIYLNSLGKVNVVRQIMECICTTINREVKAPIRLDWRTDMVDIKMIESGLAHATVTLEADTLDKTADGDMTRLGSEVSLASSVSPRPRVNTLDKRTRRKPVMRSSDFLWED
jgi:hypothetical protein